jgi:SAM-dependent methyltransferase
MWNKGWDEVYKQNLWGKYPPEELIRFIASNFNKVEDKKCVKVLEVGSGTGANIWYLTREGFDVTGIDGSKVGVERTKERLAEEELYANLICGDIESLPFESDYFDCVIDNECIYANSYFDSDKIMAEIKRVLKVNGLFYSKTFMIGSFGYGKGDNHNNEQHTFVNLSEGTSRANYGVIRFTSEEDIQNLYGKYFYVSNYEYVKRSINGRSNEIAEWVINCIKKNE